MSLATQTFQTQFFHHNQVKLKLNSYPTIENSLNNTIMDNTLNYHDDNTLFINQPRECNKLSSKPLSHFEIKSSSFKPTSVKEKNLSRYIYNEPEIEKLSPNPAYSITTALSLFEKDSSKSTTRHNENINKSIKNENNNFITYEENVENVNNTEKISVDNLNDIWTKNCYLHYRQQSKIENNNNKRYLQLAALGLPTYYNQFHYNQLYDSLNSDFLLAPEINNSQYGYPQTPSYSIHSDSLKSKSQELLFFPNCYPFEPPNQGRSTNNSSSSSASLLSAAYPYDMNQPSNHQLSSLQQFDECQPRLIEDDNNLFDSNNSTNHPVRYVKKRNTVNKKEKRRTHSINNAFSALRGCIPNVPSDTKLSKIKTLRLATSYISYLMDALTREEPKLDGGFQVEIKKKVESKDEKKRKEQEEILKMATNGCGRRVNNQSKSRMGRTGWPQQVWASEFKNEPQ